MKASGHVALAAYPFHIVGSGPGQRGVKERLGEAPHIDYQAQLAGDGQGTHMRAQSPGCLFVKAGKLELLFLNCDAGEIVGYQHDYEQDTPAPHRSPYRPAEHCPRFEIPIHDFD
jgi:hypothetical protein